MVFGCQINATSAQGAAVEPKDFNLTVFSADFSPGLLKHLNNVVTFNRFHCFRGPSLDPLEGLSRLSIWSSLFSEELTTAR